jgi:uncharacterized RDD family membrane protein YckC
MQQTYAAPVDIYAGFWRRVLALIIDGLIIGIPLSIILGAVGGGVTASNQNSGFGLIRFVVFLLYFSFMESSDYQGTLGKMALGIKVTDLEGNKITFARALGRNAAKVISTLICFIGYILAAFTERKQALHDMIASTLVVQKGAVLATAGGYTGGASYGTPPPPPAAPPTGYAPPPPPAEPSGYVPPAPPPPAEPSGYVPPAPPPPAEPSGYAPPAPPPPAEPSGYTPPPPSAESVESAPPAPPQTPESPPPANPDLPAEESTGHPPAGMGGEDNPPPPEG